MLPVVDLPAVELLLEDLAALEDFRDALLVALRLLPAPDVVDGGAVEGDVCIVSLNNERSCAPRPRRFRRRR